MRWSISMLSRSIAVFLLVLCAGAAVEHEFGQSADQPEPTWSYAFFVSYCLMFLEHIESTPEHPIAQVMHYGQPLIGVLLVSEGILRIGVNLLNKDANARTWVSIMAATTRGHVVLCGMGSVGFRVAEELLGLGVEVFAVEKDEHGIFVERARQLGVRVLIGDARGDDILRELNVKHARAVIVATDDDLANLEIAMDTRELSRDVPIVMRLFDQRLAQKVKATLGIQVSVSTSRLAAPLFASAALDPSVVGTHRVGDTVLVVVQLALGRSSILRGQRVSDLGKMGFNVVTIRTRGGEWELPPSPDRMCHEGDDLQILVPSGRLEEAHKLIQG